MTLHAPLVADVPLREIAAAPATAAAPCDNLLGVCHAIGSAFGVNPLWLRIAFSMGVLANFEAAVAAYLTGALVITLARR